MPVITRSQTKQFTKYTNKNINKMKKNNFLYYLLTEPLKIVSGVNKDAAKMENESCEDYIRRRGLPPIGWNKYNKNNPWSVSDQKEELSFLGNGYKTKEEQYKVLTYRWSEYDKREAKYKPYFAC